MSPVGKCSGSAHLPTRGGAAALVPWQSVPRRDSQVINRHNKTGSVYILTNEFVCFLSMFLNNPVLQQTAMSDGAVYMAKLR